MTVQLSNNYKCKLLINATLQSNLLSTMNNHNAFLAIITDLSKFHCALVPKNANRIEITDF